LINAALAVVTIIIRKKKNNADAVKPEE